MIGQNPILSVKDIHNVKMVRLLDLFSGTGSFAKACKLVGWEVVSLDIDPRPHLTHTVDILLWNYQKQYPPGYFDMITASPPCTNYSCANRKLIKDRNLEHSDQMVQKAIEIIDYFKPKYWLIENPQTGLLKSRPFMQGISFTDVDYCRYGYPCRKRTRFWNNIPNLSLNLCHKQCPVFDHSKNRHLYQLCITRGKNAIPGLIEYKMTLDERHAIPALLITSVFEQTNMPITKLKLKLKDQDN